MEPIMTMVTNGNSRGGIRVADLLATPSLGLELLAGESGVGRRVSWTHVSELEDPGVWMDGGELLFTLGLGIPRDARRQAHYVERLVEHHVAGLAIGVRHPPLRDQLLKTADKLEFPIVKVPREVPFLAVARMVAASSGDIAQRRLAAHVRIFDTLREQLSASRTDAELFALLEDISGYRFFLVSRQGRPILRGLPEPAPEVVDHLHEVGADERGIPGGRVVPVPMGSRTAGYLVAMERDDRESFGLSAIRHVATVAALRLAQLYRARELERRQGSEQLADLLSGRLTPGQAERVLDAADFDSSTPLVLAACREMKEHADSELHHRLQDEDIHHLMLRQGELYLLFPDSSKIIAILESDIELTVGLSRGFDRQLADFPLARREALWSLQRTSPLSTSRVVRFGADDDFAHWLPADFPSLEQLVAQILGPILAYDAEHNTELLASLASSLRQQRKLLATAKELYIHKHTLAYRLNRVEDVTGRDLDEVADQAQLWLALKALAVVNPDMVEQDPRLRV
jgi:purine catabolism regulator